MRPTILAVALAALASSEPASRYSAVMPAVPDGRVATVLEVQGDAFVRPIGRTRASALVQHAVLVPGDVVHTAARGAHALEFALGDGDAGRAVLGPASQIRFTADGVELLRGDLALAPGTGPIRVGTAGGALAEHATAIVLRATDAGLEPVAAPPGWLAAWRRSTSGADVGALIAQVDGRDVELGVQSHVVDVTIRDQIAETVVEQVFRNDTDEKLEGTFRFPLPDGASISGFEVWLDGRPVAADVVERTRARQIYEELKKKKEDPALLEWSGGNLFTARIWPIPKRGTKRIRIRHTQVLPLHGDTLRYRVPLASELLQAQQLETLRVRIAVQSTAPIGAAISPTHPVVIDRRRHTVRAELNLDGARPDRDFELAVTLAERAPLTIVDHRRGGDGWFLALLTPPGDGDAGDGWSRPLVPEGDPLDLTLVVDTSGSMHGDAHGTQLAIVEALLAQLGERDRVRVVTADREVRFATSDSAPITAATRQAVLDFVTAREPLGWTDPVATLREVLAATPTGAHVVYLGDGVPSAATIDPGAAAREIRALGGDASPTCHAVAISPTYERGVLDAIASIGHGVRADGSRSAGEVARDLLTRIASPAWHDLRIRLDGASTARLLPNPLPTLPIGSQQLIVGRYLPRSEPIEATLVAEGRLGGEPVRVARAVTLGVGAGNDFLPRLWAVRHVEALLDSGVNPRVADEVVALSSEYGFLTPLTSMLVVDDPQERERYGLERRVNIRDGERFFAAAREAAADDVIADARRWRAEARAAALEEIRGLGRDLATTAPRRSAVTLGRLATTTMETGLFADGLAKDSAFDSAAWSSAAGQYRGPGDTMPLGLGGGGSFDGPMTGGPAGPSTPGPAGPATRGLDVLRMRAPGLLQGFEDGGASSGERANSLGFFGQTRRPADPLDRWGFPASPDHPPARRPAIEGLEPSAAWDLLRGLDRRDALARIDGPLLLQLRDEALAGAAGTVVARRETELTWSSDAWTRRETNDIDTFPVIDWLHGAVRGRMVAGIELGRTRAAIDADRTFLPLDLPDHGNADLVHERVGWSASTRRSDGSDDRIELLLQGPPGTTLAERFVIDAATGLPNAYERRDDGIVVATSTWSDPVSVRGVPFMTRREDRDGDGVVTRRLWLRVAAYDAAIVPVEPGPFVVGELPDLAAAINAAARGTATPADHIVRLADAGARDQHATVAALWRAWNPAPASLGARWLQAVIDAGRRDPEAARAAAAALADAVERAPGAIRAPLAARVEALLGAHLDADARLALHERLREAWAFAADPWRREHGARRWTRRWIELLVAAQRTDDALDAWAELTARFPTDRALLLGREEALWRAQRATTALALLRDAIAGDGWSRADRDALQARLLWRLAHTHRHADAERAATAWITDGAEDPVAWLHRWAAQVLQGRPAEADAAVDATVADAAALLDADSPAARRNRARVSAAGNFLLGDAYGFTRQRPQRPDEARRLRALIETALAEPTARGLASAWATDRRFRNTAVAAAFIDALRATWLVERPLANDLAALRLVIGRVGVDALTADRRDGLVDALLGRARDADTVARRRAYTDLAIDVAASPRATELRVAVLRERIAATAHAPWRDADLDALAAALADLPWTAEREAERLAIAAAQVDREPEPRSRRHRAAQLSRALADALIGARIAAALGPVEQLELLPRRERRARERAASIEQRDELATVLAAHAASRSGGFALAWRLEAACFAAEAGRRAAARDAAVEIWNAAVAATGDDELFGILRDRAGLVLAHTAVQRDAESDFVTGVVAALERLATGGDAEPRRHALARLLIALDRPEQLVARLDGWLEGAGLQRTWRELRARLAAEAARFDAALEWLVPLDATLLGPTVAARELRAGCLQALGRDEEARVALRQALDAQSTGDLRKHVGAAIHRSNYGVDGAPEPLRAIDVHAAVSMAARASNPRVWTVSRMMNSSGVPDRLVPFVAGLTGLPTSRAIGWLEDVADQIDAVRSETPLDVLAEAIDARLATTEAWRERLHLRLLQVHVALATQSVPSRFAKPETLTASLDAIRALLVDGEPMTAADARALATGLAELGKLDEAEWRRLRLATLDALIDAAAADRWLAFDLRFARVRALAADGDVATATAMLDGLLAAARGDGPLPARANPALDYLLRRLQEHGRFTEAERLLVAVRDAAAGPDVARAYQAQLEQLHIAALQADGATSLGRGAELFAALTGRLAGRFEDLPPDELVALAKRIADAHIAAHQRRIDGVAASLGRIADAWIAATERRVPLLATQILGTLANAFVEIDQPREAIRRVAIACREQPAWFDTVGQDAWRTLGGKLVRWRAEHPTLGNVEPLLREMVLTALRRDLATRVDSHSRFWNRGDQRAWMALLDDYLRLVDEELRRAADDPEAVQWIARWIIGHLQERRPAIAALRGLDERDRLDRAGRSLLANWLEQDGDFAAALAHAERLAPDAPLDLGLQQLHARLLGRLGRTADARAVLVALVERLEAAGDLDPGVRAGIAEAARVAEAFDVAAAEYDRAIRDAARNSGPGRNDTLSDWHRAHAQALRTLGRHAEAVEAAAAAVVRADSRSKDQAFESLSATLADLPDLDAWIREHDAQVTATGEDAPVVRRALATVLRTDRREPERALEQYRLALELEPDDRELLRHVVDLAVQLDREVEALAALREAALAGRDGAAEWVEELARRLERSGRVLESVRARTQLVEALPREADGRARLARWFTATERYADAARQWELAVELRPDQSDHWLERIRVLVRIGDRDAAQRAFDAMFERDWGDSDGPRLRTAATRILAGR